MIHVSKLFERTSSSGQLQSEEWKQFAKSVRNYHGNYCQSCKRRDVQLQVHHPFYEPGRKLWEYPPEDLVVLCRPCHQELHHELNSFRKHVFRRMRPEHMRLLNLALAIGLSKNDPLEFMHAVSEMAKSPGSITRFAYAWNGGKKPQ